MLDQLIEFSRLESGHLDHAVERVSLAELADECVEALSPLAIGTPHPARAGCRRPGHRDRQPCRAVEVLRNLVDNAVRHSPDDGEVTICVGGRRRAR